MNVETFLRVLGADFYTGVPDSLLKAFVNELLHRYPNDPRHHIIAANEGNAAAIAAGYHLATGKIPVVYLQNSGEGNLVNPVASLLHPDVYAIPCIFVIGWRGEPGAATRVSRKNHAQPFGCAGHSVGCCQKRHDRSRPSKSTDDV